MKQRCDTLYSTWKFVKLYSLMLECSRLFSSSMVFYVYKSASVCSSRTVLSFFYNMVYTMRDFHLNVYIFFINVSYFWVLVWSELNVNIVAASGWTFDAFFFIPSIPLALLFSLLPFEFWDVLNFNKIC